MQRLAILTAERGDHAFSPIEGSVRMGANVLLGASHFLGGGDEGSPGGTTENSPVLEHWVHVLKGG